MQYKVVSKGAFESVEKFEQKLNKLAMEGWRVITNFSSGVYLIMGKEKH